jgi:hypothetical protein
MVACGSYSVGPYPLPVNGSRVNGLPLYTGIKADSDSKGATAVGGGGILLLSAGLAYAIRGCLGSPPVWPRRAGPCLFSLSTRSASRSLAKFYIGAANMRLGYYLGQWGDAVPATRVSRGTTPRALSRGGRGAWAHCPGGGGGRGAAGCSVGLAVSPRQDVSAACGLMSQVAAACSGCWRRLWALGILICAGARSAVTARALSPSPGPSRPGSDRDPRQGPRRREGGGSRRGVGWEVRDSEPNGTATEHH